MSFDFYITTKIPARWFLSSVRRTWKARRYYIGSAMNFDRWKIKSLKTIFFSCTKYSLRFLSPSQYSYQFLLKNVTVIIIIFQSLIEQIFRELRWKLILIKSAYSRTNNNDSSLGEQHYPYAPLIYATLKKHSRKIF